MGGPPSDHDVDAKTSVTVELGTVEANHRPPKSDPGPRNGFALALAATCVVGLLTVVLITARASRLPLEAQVESPPIETTQPIETTRLSTTVVSAVSESTKPVDLYVVRDREIEVLLTEENTLMRLEPWTGRIIWESRPFTEPQLLSINPNTVTVESQGNRLIVSLTDGTLLPP